MNTRPRRQTERLELRLAPDELRRLQEAADAAELPVSTWLRTVALAAADLQRDLRLRRRKPWE